MAFVICGRIKKKALIMETIRTVITGKFLLSAIITGIKQGFLFMTIFFAWQNQRNSFIHDKSRV